MKIKQYNILGGIDQMEYDKEKDNYKIINMDILKVSTVVKKILVNAPDTRDCDELLVLKVWAIQKPLLRSDKNYTFIDFSKAFLNKELFSVGSITRCRRKLQEEIPSLRGKNYKSRQDHQEVVKSDLKDHSMLSGGTP